MLTLNPFHSLFLLSNIALVFPNSICNLDHFESIDDIELQQGGLSHVSIYVHKESTIPYIKKVISKQTKLGKGEKGKLLSFTNEAAILQQLQSTDIAPKLFCTSDPLDISLPEYTSKAGKVYLMMEMILGQPLSLYIMMNQDAKSLSEVLLETAHTINQLHSNGVVHLDIKPENIIYGGDGKVRLIDFGGSYSSTHKLPPGFYHRTAPFYPPQLNWIIRGTPGMDWYGFGATAYFSRLFQLYPEKEFVDFTPIDINHIPENEQDLRDLVSFCLNEAASQTDLYKKIIELPYFTKKN